jgi:hypothetical protein
MMNAMKSLKTGETPVGPQLSLPLPSTTQSKTKTTTATMPPKVGKPLFFEKENAEKKKKKKIIVWFCSATEYRTEMAKTRAKRRYQENMDFLREIFDWKPPSTLLEQIGFFFFCFLLLFLLFWREKVTKISSLFFSLLCWKNRFISPLRRKSQKHG